MQLAAAARTLERIEWHDGVYVRFDDRYEATGARLTYLAATERYLLQGRPARTKFANDEGGACTRATGTYAEITRGASPPVAWPEAENRPGRVEFAQVDCAATIR
jgi:hypothetical protein